MRKEYFFQQLHFIPRVIDCFFLPWTAWLRANGFIGQTEVPALNVSEEEDGYSIAVAAPGVQKKDLFLKANRNALLIKISGKHLPLAQKSTVEKGTRHCGFSCAISLPPQVRQNMINIHLKEGILSIFYPKGQIF